MKCINCNREIDGEGLSIRVKDESIKEVHACSKICMKEVKEYQDTIKEKQTKLFIVLGIGVLLNLGVVGLFPESKLNYLILAAMSIAIFISPHVFIRFRSFKSLGIKKTLRNVKVISVILFALSIVFYFLA